MLLSQIEIVETIKLPMPNTDAKAIIHNQSALDRFVSEYGDHEVVSFQDRWATTQYDIPAFKAGRDAAINRKLNDCLTFGSN